RLIPVQWPVQWRVQWLVRSQRCDVTAGGWNAAFGSWLDGVRVIGLRPEPVWSSRVCRGGIRPDGGIRRVRSDGPATRLRRLRGRASDERPRDRLDDRLDHGPRSGRRDHGSHGPAPDPGARRAGRRFRPRRHHRRLGHHRPVAVVLRRVRDRAGWRFGSGADDGMTDPTADRPAQEPPMPPVPAPLPAAPAFPPPAAFPAPEAGPGGFAALDPGRASSTAPQASAATAPTPSTPADLSAAAQGASPSGQMAPSAGYTYPTTAYAGGYAGYGVPPTGPYVVYPQPKTNGMAVA